MVGYLDSNKCLQNTEANTKAMEKTVMGVYVIQQEGAEPADDPENVGASGNHWFAEHRHCLCFVIWTAILSESTQSSNGLQMEIKKAQFLKNKLMV